MRILLLLSFALTTAIALPITGDNSSPHSQDFESRDEDDFQIITLQSNIPVVDDTPPVSSAIVKQIVADVNHFQDPFASAKNTSQNADESEEESTQDRIAQEMGVIRQEPTFWVRMADRVQQCNEGRSLWCDVVFGSFDEDFGFSF